MKKTLRPRDSLITGNALSVLRTLDKESVDMVFADPPYNLQLRNALYRPNRTKVNAVTDDWDKFASFEDYDRFTENWLREAKRVMKPKSTLWVIGTYHNIYRIGNILQDLGFWILNDVIWEKTNPMPNFRGARFTNATETLLWCVKDKKAKGYTFNYWDMKQENGGKQMTNVWRFPLCAGRERLRDVKGMKVHSTQKPEALLERVILASTKPGDVVLDPFAGTGTTGVVAKRLGRGYILIEREARYVRAAEKRLAVIE